jgi:hypothetical protein
MYDGRWLVVGKKSPQTFGLTDVLFTFTPPFLLSPSSFSRLPKRPERCAWPAWRQRIWGWNDSRGKKATRERKGERFTAAALKVKVQDARSATRRELEGRHDRKRLHLGTAAQHIVQKAAHSIGIELTTLCACKRAQARPSEHREREKRRQRELRGAPIFSEANFFLFGRNASTVSGGRSPCDCSLRFPSKSKALTNFDSGGAV